MIALLVEERRAGATTSILAIDAEDVYWLNSRDLRSHPKVGGTAATVDSIAGQPSGSTIPNAVTASQGRVYWTDVGSGKIKTALPR